MERPNTLGEGDLMGLLTAGCQESEPTQAIK